MVLRERGETPGRSDGGAGRSSGGMWDDRLLLGRDPNANEMKNRGPSHPPLTIPPPIAPRECTADIEASGWAGTVTERRWTSDFPGGLITVEEDGGGRFLHEVAGRATHAAKYPPPHPPSPHEADPCRQCGWVAALHIGRRRPEDRRSAEKPGPRARTGPELPRHPSRRAFRPPRPPRGRSLCHQCDRTRVGRGAKGHHPLPSTPAGRGGAGEPREELPAAPGSGGSPPPAGARPPAGRG